MGWPAWSFRGVLGLAVVASCWGGWSAAGAVAGDLKVVQGRSDAPPYQVRLAGPALSGRVSQILGSINAAREVGRSRAGQRVVYLEKVSFERSAGGVVARGSFVDFSGPRRLNAVIDAFDANRAYASSSSSPVESGAGSTAFSVMLADRDDFETFSVRFLDERMEEVVMRTSDAPTGKVPPLLTDDPVQAADLGEVASRLVALGYASSDSGLREEAAAAALVERFRADHALGGPPGVTVGDLLALREVSPPAGRRAKLEDY